MTVGELKEILQQYPDYYPVLIRLAGGPPDGVDAEDIKTCSAYKSHVLIEPECGLEAADLMSF